MKTTNKIETNLEHLSPSLSSPLALLRPSDSSSTPAYNHCHHGADCCPLSSAPPARDRNLRHWFELSTPSSDPGVPSHVMAESGRPRKLVRRTSGWERYDNNYGGRRCCSNEEIRQQGWESSGMTGSLLCSLVVPQTPTLVATPACWSAHRWPHPHTPAFVAMHAH